MKYLTNRLRERSTAAGVGSLVTTGILLATGGVPAQLATPELVTGLAGLLLAFLPTSRGGGR